MVHNLKQQLNRIIQGLGGKDFKNIERSNYVKISNYLEAKIK